MGHTQKGPFDRVADGYDPQQVAAFAAEALGWKRDLAACRNDLQAAMGALDHYESVIGTIEDVEREAVSLTEDAERRAAEIIARAEEEAAGILAVAQPDADHQTVEPESNETPSTDMWLTPSVEETHDPIDEIFEELVEDEEPDPEAERDKRVAAAAANLWKRRGVLTPPE